MTAAQLRSRRVAAHLTQAQLGRIAGWPDGKVVSMYESGYRPITRAAELRLSAALAGKSSPELASAVETVRRFCRTIDIDPMALGAVLIQGGRT